MSNSILNCTSSGYPLHIPIGAVCVGERDNLFVKIQHCFFVVSLKFHVSLKAVFTLFSSSPVQMQSCIAQLAVFKETLENCDVTNRVQRNQLSPVFTELPQYIKSKFVHLCQQSLVDFAQTEDQGSNRRSLENFLKECDCIISIQKILLPVRNFFSKTHDRVDPDEEVIIEREPDPVSTDPRTNPRVKLRNSEKQKRDGDPLVKDLNDAHRKRAKQIKVMSSIIEILVNKNIDPRSKKLKNASECPIKQEIMEVPVYPYTDTYNGTLHRLDLEYYLYDGNSGPLEGDAFVAALTSKPGYKCYACVASPNGCVPPGSAPDTVLKVDTAFQRVLVKELVSSFANLTDAQIGMALEEMQDGIQAAELSSKERMLPANQVRKKILDLLNDFPPGQLKQRMQKILRIL